MAQIARNLTDAFGGFLSGHRFLIFLLGLSVPFAYYTSEVLDDWLGRGGWVRIAIGSVLAGLVVLIAATFTFSDLFWDREHMEKPGVVWQSGDIEPSLPAIQVE